MAHNDTEYDEWGELSEGAQDLISGMLNCEPEKRYANYLICFFHFFGKNH